MVERAPKLFMWIAISERLKVFIFRGRINTGSDDVVVLKPRNGGGAKVISQVMLEYHLMERRVR